MASITTSANGTRAVQFVSPHDAKRKTLRLGRVNLKAAQTVKTRVEQLVAALITKTTVDDDCSRWLAGVADELHERLAKVGLVESRVPVAKVETPTLGVFVAAFIAARAAGWQAATRVAAETQVASLLTFFGGDRPLDSVTPGDVDEFVRSLKRRYAPATVARRIKVARSVFRSACRHRLIAANVFDDVRLPSQVNASRAFFVTREATAKLLDACPSLEWRTIVALSRLGGLRTPSETLRLTWNDVDWDAGKMRVGAGKTAERMVPLFPELRAVLADAFDAAEEGSVYVVDRYRDPSQNLRYTLGSIIKRAGMTVWPRAFHNMRASRETELAAEFPLHVACSWIGNSERIAQRHYLQVTDSDFDRAAGGRAAESDVTALRNPVRTATDGKGQETTAGGETPDSPDFRPFLSRPDAACTDGPRVPLDSEGRPGLGPGGGGRRPLAPGTSGRHRGVGVSPMADTSRSAPEIGGFTAADARRTATD